MATTLTIADVWCSDLPDSRGNGPLIVEAVNAYDSLRTRVAKLEAALRELEWQAGNHAAAIHAVGRECTKLDAALETARAALNP